jgi:aryl-alcohol dehydrogenase (NADP+)
MARGFLAGNRNKEKSGETTRAKSDDYARSMYFTESDYDVLNVAEKLAKEHGVAPAQIALAWILHKPGVTAPIIGATKMPHLEQAVQALEIKLSEEEIAALEEPYVPHEILGHS